MSNVFSKLVAKHTPLRIKGILRSFVTPRLEHLPKSPELFRVYYSFFRNPDLKRNFGGWEYRGIFYPDYLTVGGVGHAIAHKALLFCKGHGIDVGAGYWPLSGSIAVDPYRGPGIGKTVSDYDDESLDYVFSSHCLEHIDEWQVVLHKWLKKLKPGGVVFLYMPHPDCPIWQPGSPFVGNGHKYLPSLEELKSVLGEASCSLEQVDEGPDSMLSYFVCARKTNSNVKQSEITLCLSTK